MKKMRMGVVLFLCAVSTVLGQANVPVEFSAGNTNGQVAATLLWGAEPGDYYEILSTTNLASGIWTNATIDPVPATNLVAQIEILSVNPASYFRVQHLDTQGPKIVSRYPNPDGTGVGLGTPLTVVLSDSSGINTNGFRLVVNGGAAFVPGNAGMSVYTNGFSFTPQGAWGDYGSTATVAVTSMDIKGNPSVEEWEFVLEVQPVIATNLIHLASAQPFAKASAVSRNTLSPISAAAYADGLTIVEILPDSIVFDYGSGGHGLYVGAILISHDISNFFYRRITALDDDPANYRIVASTVEVPLTEVVKEGSFSSESITLSQGAMAIAIEPANIGDLIINVGVPFSYSSEFNVGTLEWPNVRINPSALKISLAGNVELSGQINNWKPVAAGAEFSSNLHIELRSGIEIYSSLDLFKKSLPLNVPVVLATVPVGSIGPIPVVATIELQPFLKFDCSSEAAISFETGLDFDQTDLYAINWTPEGGVVKSHTGSRSLVAVPLDIPLEISAEANLYLTAQLSANIYGLAGPAIDLRAGPGIKASYTVGDPQCEIKLYGKVSLNGKFNIKGVSDSLLPEVTFLSYSQYLKTWYWPEIPLSAPVILQQPGSIPAAQGQNVTFNASVSGNPAPTYKWYVNGNQIPGQYAAGLTVTAGSQTSGNYKFKASNSLGSVYSAEAALTLSGGGSSGEFAFIPGGSFQMGDSKDEGSSRELPVHSVYVSGFYMGKTEVTKAQWDDVYNWAVANGYSFDYAGSGMASNYPVHDVNWYDVVKWCNARSEKENKTPCYNLSTWSCNFSANGYRLPTEAEWEKAARGNLSGRRFPWGDTINHNYANYRANGSEYSYDTSPYTTKTFHPSYYYEGYPHTYTSPASSFAPSGYGLYGMGGNVLEWCGDWYEKYYYASSPSSNPRGGPSTSALRVLRGGSWGGSAYFSRAACRGLSPPDHANYAIGFRVVLPPGQ